MYFGRVFQILVDDGTNDILYFETKVGIRYINPNLSTGVVGRCKKEERREGEKKAHSLGPELEPGTYRIPRARQESLAAVLYRSCIDKYSLSMPIALYRLGQLCNICAVCFGDSFCKI